MSQISLCSSKPWKYAVKASTFEEGGKISSILCEMALQMLGCDLPNWRSDNLVGLPTGYVEREREGAREGGREGGRTPRIPQSTHLVEREVP